MDGRWQRPPNRTAVADSVGALGARLLYQLGREGKFLAVIDEFPLLLSDRREERRGFLSELQKVNARISASVRGQFQDALRHLRAKAGCAVVTVPARGTSAICPRCGRRLRHYTSPERLRSGYHWAGCGTTPPLSDCAVAITGPTARIADSPRTGTMPPRSASALGASAPSRLSTRIAGPGIWRSTKPTTPRWRAACAAGPS